MSDFDTIKLLDIVNELRQRIEALEKRKSEEQDFWVSIAHQIQSLGDE